ncbi:hypothetical protein [Salibacterium salarium]|uniref:hypothetical protein n=1 Tax=Salibacterium salarium TaxID=284579 RepID=UPI00163A1D0E|nr:hypothetical protein [Salibacterium salarium]
MSNQKNIHLRKQNQYKEEVGHELGFFRDLSEIKALASLKVVWENVKKQKREKRS